MKLSKRVENVPYSAIRKLTPLANEAKSRGIKIYHLNVGQPDVETPDEFFEAVKNIDIKRLAYAPSKGMDVLLEATSGYYKEHGIDFSKDEIVITAGASEALAFALYSVADPGDGVLTSNPFYANYNTIFKALYIETQTFDTYVENGYALPDYETIEKSVKDNTKAILLSNPSNPTGAVYTEEEIKRIVKLAIEKDLYIIADEVYREYVFDNNKFMSFAEIEGIEDRLILLDSISKRFSACGARIGSVASKNKDIMANMVKLATARLAAPTVEQIGASALYKVQKSYFEDVKEEYEKRRDCIFEELQKIEGVKVYKPKGAFYVMPTLPVKDTEDFAKWMLTDFSINNETVMVAPAGGFYNNSDLGKSQVRMAFVLNCEDLKKAIKILKAGIEEYNRTR